MSLEILNIEETESSQGHHLREIAQKFRTFFVSLRSKKEYKKSEHYQRIRGYSNGNVGSALIEMEEVESDKYYVAFSSLHHKEELSDIFEWFINESFEYKNEVIALWKDGKVQTRNFDHLEVSGDNVLNGEGAYPRHFDSEFKILDRIIDDLEKLKINKQTKIHIHLYTYKYPCFGCEDVFTQLGKFGYKDLHLSVYWEKKLS